MHTLSGALVLYTVELYQVVNSVLHDLIHRQP